MSYRKTIYKTDTKDKLRFITVWTDGEFVHQESGIFGSEKTVLKSYAAKPKNVGKANETSAEEQAVKEAEAKVTKKLDGEYFESVEEAKNTEVILPMLAKDFSDHKHKIQYPCWVQPKLDGMRAIFLDDLISRENKKITTVPHIEEELKKFEEELSVDVRFDGELYSHGDSFQENMRLTKKFREGETDKKIKFHVYDLVQDLPFDERYRNLEAFLKKNGFRTIQLVPRYEVNSEEEMIEKHKLFISEGYEGTIIRHGQSNYESNKRSDSLLKYKEFDDDVFDIIDIAPMEKYPEQGMVVIEQNGARVEITPKMTHEGREDLLTNKHEYVGCKAEIRFFGYTDDGNLRMPVCVWIHKE